LHNEFITVLEETGDIITIAEWIIRTACQQLKDWWLAGFLINRVCVNLSAYQFRSKNLIRAIVESIESAGLEPDNLELEITESLLLEEDIDLAIKTLGHLRDIGVRVAIDNFGTGYASLNYLKRFPADCLKIENSFIEGGTPQDAAIMIATIDMAHALGLLVVSEGVETIEQADFLRDQACDFAQGYLYTVPLNRTESLEWIKEYAKKHKLTPL
jgi:EAL domain-containing protein (putative c-di-GMP-specific phosphodiesterase class I)